MRAHSGIVVQDQPSHACLSHHVGSQPSFIHSGKSFQDEECEVKPKNLQQCDSQRFQGLLHGIFKRPSFQALPSSIFHFFCT